MLKKIIEELQKTEHGFKHIEKAGKALLNDAALDHQDIAAELMKEESYQGRMLGTFLLGQLSPENKKAFELLKSRVSKDENWRVQEMLAKAIDHYCKSIGYEHSLPVIKSWLKDKDPNLNRAVVEGLRIWTARPYFKEHPEVAIELIAGLKENESEYVRKSVGNALRDIRKKHKALIDKEVGGWDLSNKHIAYTSKLIDKH